MRFSIRFINTTTCGAGARSVPWIHKDHRNSHSLRLVANVLSQLEKRPVGMSRSLLASYRYPFTDTAQFFEGNGAMGVIRNLYDRLADRVVGHFLETGLPARDLFEFSSGRLRTVTLQVAAAMLKLSASILNHCSAKPATVTIRGDVHNAEINPKNPFNVYGLGGLHIASYHQVELAFDHAKIAFPMLAFEQFKLALAAGKRHLLSACSCPDIQLQPVQFIGQDAIIESDSAMRFESPFGFSVQLVSVSDFGNRADNHLRAQVKDFLHGIIGKFVKRKLPKGLTLPGLIADVVTRGVCHFQSFAKCLCLFGRRQEFYLSDQFYNWITSLLRYIENAKAQEHRHQLSLPTPKGGGFSLRSR